MANYISVEEARNRTGLRIVVSPGLPAPWTESCKNIYQIKGLDFVLAAQEFGQERGALYDWSAQTSAPVVAWESERPRSTWIEQLYLAERLSDTPPLIPESTEEQVQMFGLGHVLLGENGFVWNRRHQLIEDLRREPELLGEATGPLTDYFAKIYLYNDADAKAALGRCVAVLELFTAQLERQHAAGSRFLVGDRLSALDIYWACSATLVEPLPEDVNPMPAHFRKIYANSAPEIRAAAEPLLMAHRDFIYRDFLRLPLDF